MIINTAALTHRSTCRCSACLETDRQQLIRVMSGRSTAKAMFDRAEKINPLADNVELVARITGFSPKVKAATNKAPKRRLPRGLKMILRR